MLFVNFKAYNSYVTDSLYQWDINQKLNIVGLNLTEAPEVHFANANMERAIVRQSTINKDTITVAIPNSLLQEPLLIKAYIGVYEGETFKIIETVKIPVIPKERPTDYKFEDDGGDIYSYNEILNKMIAFENKYGDVDLNAIREYNAWVTDILILQERMLSAENALEIGAKIATGSYEGTGTEANGYVGVNNKNIITLPFTPKMVVIVGRTRHVHAIWLYGQPIGRVDGSDSGTNNLMWSNNSLEWYANSTSDGGANQLNKGGDTYDWIAIG